MTSNNYQVTYKVVEDEGQTEFHATFTVTAENEREAVSKAGDLIYGTFLTDEYTFDWEFPISITKAGNA